MRSNIWKKEMVFVVIILFVGASIITNICGYEIDKKIDKHENNIIKIIQQTHSEPPTILWNKTFGGNKGDDGIKIRKTTDNGFIIIGY